MAGHSPSQLRTTQRAPRSCVACSARKVKCDKAIPCSTCIRRGTADSCVREVVIVRGEVKTATDLPEIPSYGDLWRENQRLRAELDSLQPQTGRGRLSSKPESEEVYESILFKHCEAELPRRASERLSWSSIAVPDRACSEQLVEYDKTWNSWAHYAIEYPRFDDEHEAFLSSLQRGAALESIDAAWLAVYFSVLCAALLMMDDDEARKLSLPGRLEYTQLCRHWYHAALFCLNEADFMRVASIRTVQAVAILGMCFRNFGDTDLCMHMWSCALRIAQKLGVDDPKPSPDSPLSPEAQRRLWWTLVICEWLVVPYHPPQIEEGDFSMTLPSPDPLLSHSDSGDVQPVYYHIFMSRTSTVCYRFRARLRDGVQPVADAVRQADGELAEVINTLPTYLQPDYGETETVHKLEDAYPWIKWQRFDIALVLLHHRLRISRVLQPEWLLSPEKYEWARSVCIRSATSIIWISRNWDQPATMRKQWALSMHLFAAAVLLFRESKHAKGNASLAFRDEIASAIAQLDEVAPQNAVAAKAAMLLRSLLDGAHALEP